MKKDLIYNPQDNEQKLFGIQPKNQLAYRLFVIFRWSFLGSVFFSVLSFLSISFMNLSDDIKTYVVYGIMGLLVFGLSSLLLGLMTRILFLRKAPFDNWILDIAEKTLGTKVILYSSKTIYIQYDRNNKEVDKKEFIQKMTERSERYSYFLVKTHIDEGFLEVACTTRQPIPTMALKKEEDDTLFNVVPLGLALNNVTKKISPVGWVINTENKNENMIETLPAVALAIVGGTGSGKSVCLNNIMAHISKFPDKIQAVGIDLKQVEFTQFRGLRGFKSVAWDIHSASELTTAFRRIMDKRFAMMRENKTNNIFKIKNLEVDYYTLGGIDYQFDEIFEVIRDLDPESREYRKLKTAYPNGRQATIMTIEELYEGIKSGAIKNPQIPERKGVNSWLDEYSIRKTKGEFKPKLSIMMVDELNELMTNGDYHAVDTIKGNINSICRLGRAAGVHSVFAMQNANGSAMSGDMRANISSSIIFGDFDGTASTNLFERDYSNMSRPEIKGRGIMNSGKDIIEFQGYYASEEDSWHFDENLKWTYENPIYDKQCEKKGIIPDPTGFIKQIKPGDKVEIDIETIRRSKQKEVEAVKEEPKVEVSHEEPKKLKLNIKK